jgi:nucleotide-binding universal stress UspA family protein
VGFQKGGGVMVKKIMLPLDGSELAAKVLPHVEDLAKALRAEVTLFAVRVCGREPL